MASKWAESFPKILQEMLSRKDSEHFQEPVDWKALNLFDYPKIIKQPMDLQTVQGKFERKQYSTPSDLAFDIRLTFFNAMTYNPLQSKIYSHAKSLSEFWESRWKTLVSPVDDPNRPPTADQLSDFVDKCHRMTPDSLGQALLILDKHCPNCLFKKPNSSEIEINTDLINGAGFDEASAFVNSIISDVIAPIANPSVVRRTSSRRAAAS